MNRDEQKKLALAEIILIALAVVGLAVIIWVAWIAPSRAAKQIMSYEDCTKAGNPVQDSYPEVCVTADGKRFTNPQAAPSKQNQPLKIAEWQVATTINGVNDAYYTYDAVTKMALVSTHGLDGLVKGLSGCTSGLHALYYLQLKPGDAKEAGGIWTEAELQASGSKVGDYYYVEEQGNETLCIPENSDEVTVIKELQEAIRTAMRNLQHSS